VTGKQSYTVRERTSFSQKKEDSLYFGQSPSAPAKGEGENQGWSCIPHVGKKRKRKNPTRDYLLSHARQRREEKAGFVL